MIHMTDDAITVMDDPELSQTAKGAIESMQIALAGEITTYLGTIMQAATAKMMEAINRADLPSAVSARDLEKLIKESMSRGLGSIEGPASTTNAGET